MLNTPPWSRLPLQVNWLIPKYQQPLNPSPPPHVVVRSGFIGLRKKQKHVKLINPIPNDKSGSSSPSMPVIIESDDSFSDHSGFMSLAAKLNQKQNNQKTERRSSGTCEFCGNVDNEEMISCAAKSCPALFHLTCLAIHLAGDKELIPLEFKCHNCSLTMPWGSFIRTYVKKEHYYEDLIGPDLNPFIGANRIEQK